MNLKLFYIFQQKTRILHKFMNQWCNKISPQGRTMTPERALPFPNIFLRLFSWYGLSTVDGFRSMLKGQHSINYPSDWPLKCKFLLINHIFTSNKTQFYEHIHNTVKSSLFVGSPFPWIYIPMNVYIYTKSSICLPIILIKIILN